MSSITVERLLKHFSFINTAQIFLELNQGGLTWCDMYKTICLVLKSLYTNLKR